MKITLVQAICTKESSNGVRFIQKDYETEIKPSVGDSVTNDSFWKDPYEYPVTYVEIDFAENHCRVVLDDFHVSSIDEIQKMQDLAVKYHGWKKGGAVLG